VGTPTSKTEVLLTSEFELVKQYLEIDTIGRPLYLYTGPANAKDGAPVLVTEMLYIDSTSTLLKAKKDGYAQWSTLYVPDSLFTVPDVFTEKTAIIQTLQKELSKQHQLLDSQMRPLRIYEGPVFMKTGSPCKVTEYIYQNATSSLMKGKKESYATWDESWIPDTLFTVDY
jgi:hypothetical protein